MSLETQQSKISEEDRLKVYSERHTRWQDEAMSHMGFFNNLLLTLATGLITFAFRYVKFDQYTLGINNLNCKATLMSFSVWFTVGSILIGLYLALNRLLDFRIARHINLTRYRVLKQTSEYIKDKEIEIYDCWKRLTLPFECLCDPIMFSLKDCKEYVSKNRALDANFTKLRSRSHALGLNTWCLLLLQIFLFLLSVLFYALATTVSNE
ncbi:MAG: hypothetical protein SFW35_03025 [Chitinophagales bacterium]|nr:hypothetical protein [Chitinophagales bacterium]